MTPRRLVHITTLAILESSKVKIPIASPELLKELFKSVFSSDTRTKIGKEGKLVLYECMFSERRSKIKFVYERKRFFQKIIRIISFSHYHHPKNRYISAAKRRKEFPPKQQLLPRHWYPHTQREKIKKRNKHFPIYFFRFSTFPDFPIRYQLSLSPENMKVRKKFRQK